MGEQINRAEVDDRIERLQSEYGDVDPVDAGGANNPEFFRDGLDHIEDGFVGAAAAWVSDDRGRVLMVRFRNQPHWGIPGASHEPGESLVETARRGVFEGVGISVEPQSLFHLVRRHFYPRDDPERRAYTVEAWFEADYVEGEVALVDDHRDADDPIVEARWMASPPETVIDVLEGQVERWDWPGE